VEVIAILKRWYHFFEPPCISNPVMESGTQVSRPRTWPSRGRPRTENIDSKYVADDFKTNCHW